MHVMDHVQTLYLLENILAEDITHINAWHGPFICTNTKFVREHPCRMRNLQNRFRDVSVICRWLTTAPFSHRATSSSGNIKVSNARRTVCSAITETERIPEVKYA